MSNNNSNNNNNNNNKQVQKNMWETLSVIAILLSAIALV